MSYTYYLASPYSYIGNDPAQEQLVQTERYLEVNRVAVELLKQHVAVFSPIAYNHPMKDWGLPTDWKFWEKIDKAFLAKCDCMLVLTMEGWDKSTGVKGELDYCKKNNIPVLYISSEDVFKKKIKLETIDSLEV